MAALEKTGGSRTGSLSIENNENVNSQTSLLCGHQNGGGGGGGDIDHSNSLASLARRNTMRKRSLRYVDNM